MYSRWYSKEYKEDRRRYRLAKANYSHLSEKFSGLAGYYKRFVKDFPKIAAPLTRLTLKKMSSLTGLTDVKNIFSCLRIY